MEEEQNRILMELCQVMEKMKTRLTTSSSSFSVGSANSPVTFSLPRFMSSWGRFFYAHPVSIIMHRRLWKLLRRLVFMAAVWSGEESALRSFS